MEVKTIGIIGAGTMGRGIAYAAAFGGYKTILEDVSPAMLDEAVALLRTRAPHKDLATALAHTGGVHFLYGDHAASRRFNEAALAMRENLSQEAA